MDKSKFEKACAIMHEIDKLEYALSENDALPVKVVNVENATNIVKSLFLDYENEISEFCESLLKRHRQECQDRIALLKAKFALL